MDLQEFAALLNDISVCFINRDFDLWESRIHLPFTIVSQIGPETAHTTEQLRANFELYLLACKTMQVDIIHREPMTLEDCGDGTFIATYRTELLSRGVRQTDPFISSALIVESDDMWRVTSILNARGHHGWTGHQPHQSGEHK